MVAKKRSKNVSKTLKKSGMVSKNTAPKKTASGDFGMKSINKDSVSKDDSVFWKVATLVLGIALVVMIAFGNGSVPEGDDVSAGAEKIDIGVLGENVKSFVEENLIQEGMTAEVIDISEERGVYKIVVNVDFGGGQGQNVTSYSTLDGKYFFATGLDMVPEEEAVENDTVVADDTATGDSGSDDTGTDASNSPTGEVVSDSGDDATGDAAASAGEEEGPAKVEMPVVELFVMSHCPYGTQAVKGIIPAVEALGDKIDFTLRFVNYAMHAEKEVVEQTKQYCIQKDQNDTLFASMKCFPD